MNKLNGLDYEFINRNGTCLAVQPGEGFSAEELSRIPLKMIMTGKVPRLLPIMAEQTDERTRLVYEIGTRRMLSHVLDTERLTLILAFQLLMTIIDVMEASRSYMLQENAFVLSESFLFIGADPTDVYLIYLPLKDLKASAAAEQLKQFIQALAKRFPMKEQVVLQEWAALCDSVSAPISELRQKLQQMWSSSISSLPDEPLWPQTLQPSRPVEQPTLVPPVSPSNQKSFSTNELSTIESFRKTASMICFAFGVVCSAMVWAQYADSVTTERLNLSLGTTLLFTAAWFAIRYAANDEQLAVAGKIIRRLRRRNALSDPITEESESFSEVPDMTFLASGVLPAADITSIDYYDALNVHTSLLRAPSDSTVLLGAEIETTQVEVRNAAGKAFLEISGIGKQLPIEKNSFKIGRSEELADCLIEAPGISRQHAEITLEDGTYSLKDLGSTNGTFLNGERMVPYRTYSLSKGDNIRVVQTEIRFLLI